jgi:hypothetical protein
LAVTGPFLSVKLGMKKFVFLLFFAAFSVISNAQDVFPSNTYVRTCLSDIECSSINSSSYLFYDEVKSKFYIKIDFNRLKTGVDSIDFWLEDLSDTYFYFKATLLKEQLPSLSSYNRKMIRLNGQAFLNNIWRPMVMEVSFFRAQDDMMNNNTNPNEFQAYKVSFNFSISPKDFNIHKKPQKLTNTIFIGVGAGQLNVLRPGMESLVGEAYSHE